MDTKKSQDRKPRSSVRNRNRTVKKQYPDEKLDGDSVCSEASMPRGLDFSGNQQHNFRNTMEETATNSNGEPRSSSNKDGHNDESETHQSEARKGSCLIHQSGVCKRCERSCGVCLENIHAVKHCKTCRMSYCETHVADHYKSPAFSSHELVEYKQPTGGRAGGLLAFCSSVLRRSAGTLWMLLSVVSALALMMMLLTFLHSYEVFSEGRLGKGTFGDCPQQGNGLCSCKESDPVVIPEVIVMMLGKTGAGKSASGNTILGRKAFKSEASDLPVTKSYGSQSGVVEGRNITVIDTPAITTRKAAWLSEKVDPGPHVFLLVIPLRRFTEEDGKEVKWIQSNFGEEALKFTIFLFTGRDQMDQKNIEQFLNERSGLQTLVSSTGGRYHIFDNTTPEGHGQVKGLLEKIELLLRKNMGYSYSHGLHEQVKTAVREEEERKRRKEEVEEKKREKMERDMQFNQVMKTMQERIKGEIMEQMKSKMMTRIANATATLNELMEVVMATTEQGGNSLQEQVKTAEREEEERKWLK